MKHRAVSFLIHELRAFHSRLNLAFSLLHDTTRDGLFAKDLRPSVKAHEPSAKALPRAALGKELSGNFESVKRVFAEGPLSDTRQSLCRGLERHSAKKSSRHGADA